MEYSSFIFVTYLSLVRRPTLFGAYLVLANKMRLTLVFWLLASLYCYSQTSIRGIVKDAETDEPLSYCAVAIKGSSKGSVTNMEGAFKISVSNKDTLLFSFIGYNTLSIPVAVMYKQPEVKLVRKSVQLKEIEVHGNNDYLYEIMDRCRKEINKSSTRVAKVYMELETEIQNQPVELLQCYYNARLNGASIENLILKNGRVGLAAIDNRYFVSLSTSKVICDLHLTSKNEYFPFIPFQYAKSKLKKNFILSLEYSDATSYQIKFSPRKNNRTFFKGDVWIERETHSILSITLTGENLSVYPFIPIFSEDSLYNVSLDVTQTYKKNKYNSSVLNHINFNYKMNYISTRALERSNAPLSQFRSRRVTTSGVMYVYDYGSSFTLPYFEYDDEHDDYRKISFLPYNNAFWKSGNGLLTSEKQKYKLSFIEKEGMLLNFYDKDLLASHGTFFETNNIFWKENKRLSHSLSIPRKDTLSQSFINQSYQTDLYNIRVQLFLDINQIGDSIQHLSATVFDVFESFYHLPEQSYTNCFLNIYFDLCEIERQRMEKTLTSRQHTMAEIDAIYKQTVVDMNATTSRYLKEVKLGENTKNLKKWNKIVDEFLGIDNVKLFGL